MKRILIISGIASFAVLAMAGETVSEAMKKLETLHGMERAAYYHSLPEKTKEAVTGIQRQQLRKHERIINATMVKARELEFQGVFQFELMSYTYEEAAGGVIAQMQSPELPEKEKERTTQKRFEFLKAIYAAPAPPMIELWKKYKDRAEPEWKAYRKIAPDAEAFRKIEEGLMNSIIREARKLA